MRQSKPLFLEYWVSVKVLERYVVSSEFANFKRQYKHTEGSSVCPLYLLYIWIGTRFWIHTDVGTNAHVCIGNSWHVKEMKSEDFYS